MDKHAVIAAFEQHQKERIGNIEKDLEKARDGVRTAPGPSQSHSDTTRFQEGNIVADIEERLARAKRILRQLREIPQAQMETISNGSIFVLEDVATNERDVYFVVPEGGGESIDVGGAEVVSISKDAPIAKEVWGKGEGVRINFRGRLLKVAEVK